MDSPLFWNMPSRARYYSPAEREIPVQRRSTAAPKVVSIPVQFVRSDLSRSDSALKIQKVFRAFLVRKGVRKVLELRKEVDEIERRISDEEVVDLIRRPGSKERIKLIESLMSLLFRLDSIRGVDTGVRDCRKATIKKAIALQEAIDAIVDAIVAGESKDRAPETKDPDSGDISGNNKFDSSENSEFQSHDDSPVLDSGEIEEAQATSKPNLEPDCAEIEEAEAESPNSSPSDPDPQFESEIEQNQKPEASTEPEINQNSKDSSMEETESVSTIQIINQPDPTSNSLNSSMEEEEEEDSAPKIEETAMETHLELDRTVENQNSRGRDALVKMMEENERMVGLMEELVEKNEKQTKLLNSLSQRVEMLERAFVCDKLRKSKKKRRSC